MTISLQTVGRMYSTPPGVDMLAHGANFLNAIEKMLLYDICGTLFGNDFVIYVENNILHIPTRMQELTVFRNAVNAELSKPFPEKNGLIYDHTNVTILCTLGGQQRSMTATNTSKGHVVFVTDDMNVKPIIVKNTTLCKLGEKGGLVGDNDDDSRRRSVNMMVTYCQNPFDHSEVDYTNFDRQRFESGYFLVVPGTEEDLFLNTYYGPVEQNH